MNLSNFTQYYIVGNHCFSISPLFKIDIVPLFPSYETFRTEKNIDKCLFQIHLSKKLLSLSSSTEISHFELDEASCIIRENDSMYEIVITPKQDTIQRKMRVNKNFSRAETELLGSSSIDIMVLNNFIMMLYAFASAPYNTLLIHASVITYKNKGYLFLGKSGTGKSTHSRLWIENVDEVELLNDDNPVVRFESNGEVLVYGSPWSGKTPCYMNKTIAVGAIVRLKQAPYNKISKLGTIQAFTSLISSCSCLKQVGTVKEGIYDTISLLTTIIPTYKLKCLPNKEAVAICKEGILNRIDNEED